MAKKDHTSKTHPGRNSGSAKRSASNPPKPAKAAPNLEALEEIVEEERLRLMKAHSILSCVITAMEDEDICTGDGPYWPAVIESACDLVNESIRRLEDLDYSPKRTARSVNEVREPAPDFGYAVAPTSSLSTRDADDGSESKWWLTGEKAEEADTAAAQAPVPIPPLLN